MLLSSLFHSITVDEKKEFRKYSCVPLNKGMLWWFSIIRVNKTYGIYQRDKSTITLTLAIQDLIPGKPSLLKNLR